MEVKNNQGQAEKISSLIEESDGKNSKGKEIQRVYLRYSETMEESDLGELFRLLDSYCVGYVRRQLYNKGCYSVDNEYDILTDSKLVIWDYIRKNREEKKEHFANYAFGIYRNKAEDLIRKKSKIRKRMPTDSITGEEGEDLEIGVMDEAISEIFENRTKTMMRLLHIYCETFLDLASPTRSAAALLALCYARILSHMLEEIPDNKATSAKWAFGKMGNQSLYGLRRESEEIITDWFDDKALVWGQSFLDQLSEIVDDDGRNIPRGDTIYTAHYGAAKIEDWADSMHRATMRKAIEVVNTQQDLKEEIRDSYSRTDILQKFYKGER